MAAKTIWKIDPSHSEIQFMARSMVISTVTGQFNNFEGRLETENDDFENAKAYFEADTKSIFTNNKNRDRHLKSEEFFDVESYPALVFDSTSFKKTNDEYSIIGKLTIRGISNEVQLKATHGGTITGLHGNTKAGFEVTGSINRKDFGLNWDAVTEGGNNVLGDTIILKLNLQLIRES